MEIRCGINNDTAAMQPYIQNQRLVVMPMVKWKGMGMAMVTVMGWLIWKVRLSKEWYCAILRPGAGWQKHTHHAPMYRWDHGSKKPNIMAVAGEGIRESDATSDGDGAGADGNAE